MLRILHHRSCCFLDVGIVRNRTVRSMRVGDHRCTQRARNAGSVKVCTRCNPLKTLRRNLNRPSRSLMIRSLRWPQLPWTEPRRISTTGAGTISVYTKDATATNQAVSQTLSAIRRHGRVTEPQVGQIVHYVMEASKVYGKRHLNAVICGVSTPTKFKSQKICTLSLVDYDGEQIDVPMALSREAGTWHQIGGYGCER